MVSIIGIFSLSYRKSATSFSEACLLGGIASLSPSVRRSSYSEAGQQLYVLERSIRADEEDVLLEARWLVHIAALFDLHIVALCDLHTLRTNLLPRVQTTQ